MGWELEARLAKRGAHELDVDSLMRLAKKNDDVKTIIKLEAIKAMSSNLEAVVAGSYVENISFEIEPAR